MADANGFEKAPHARPQRRGLLIRSLACTALCVLLPLRPASAQTHIRLTTPQGACVFTTDAAGVALDPGNGDLVAAGTLGSGCGGAGVTAPSFIDPLTGDLAASTTLGTPLTLTWKASAEACSYTGTTFPAGASFANWPATGAACTSEATCNTAHQVVLTPTVAGSYTFALSCTRSGSSTPATSSASTTVSEAATGCIAPAGLTRLTTATVTTNAPNPKTRPNIDVRQFANLWGYRASGSALPWPSVNGQLSAVTVPRDKYVAAEFTVPAAFPLNVGGHLQFGGTNLGGAESVVSMTISDSCGDFRAPAENPISPACVLDSIPNTNDGAALWWGNYTPGSNAWNQSCHLTPGHTYYVNILFAPLSAPTTPACASGSCSVGVVNGPGNF